jgi:hypothetical protein
MNKDLEREVARLESQVDVLDAELCHLDSILKKSGFTDGIETLKKTVEDLLKEVEGGHFPEIDFDSLFG